MFRFKFMLRVRVRSRVRLTLTFILLVRSPAVTFMSPKRNLPIIRLLCSPKVAYSPRNMEAQVSSALALRLELWLELGPG